MDNQQVENIDKELVSTDMNAIILNPTLKIQEYGQIINLLSKEIKLLKIDINNYIANEKEYEWLTIADLARNVLGYGRNKEVKVQIENREIPERFIKILSERKWMVSEEAVLHLTPCRKIQDKPKVLARYKAIMEKIGKR